MHTKSFSENLKERNHLGNFGMSGRIILKYILDRARECEVKTNGGGYY
jgi:hypothetical protein